MSSYLYWSRILHCYFYLSSSNDYFHQLCSQHSTQIVFTIPSKHGQLISSVLVRICTNHRSNWLTFNNLLVVWVVSYWAFWKSSGLYQSVQYDNTLKFVHLPNDDDRTTRFCAIRVEPDLSIYIISSAVQNQVYFYVDSNYSLLFIVLLHDFFIHILIALNYWYYIGCFIGFTGKNASFGDNEHDRLISADWD